MCSRKAPRHPTCGHAAHGTALAAAIMHKCNRADKQPCKSVVWDSYDVPRALCDRCIINGEIIAQKRGLDVGVYARRMGASYQALVDANPAALPTPPPSRSLPRKTAKLQECTAFLARSGRVRTAIIECPSDSPWTRNL